MILIGENSFAKNDQEFVSSLFKPHKGTCYGYYKRKGKNVILLQNMQKETFAALVKNKTGKFFVNAREMEGGKIFYQHALSKHLENVFYPPKARNSYLAACEFVDSLVEQYLPVKE